MSKSNKLSCRTKCLLALAAGAALGLIGERVLPGVWNALKRALALGRNKTEALGSPILSWFMDPAHFALLFLLFNLLSFFLFWLDKKKAEAHKWRIPEAVLILASVFGIFGGIFGMYFFRHKTKKPKFYIGLPLILLAELVVAVCLLYTL